MNMLTLRRNSDFTLHNCWFWAIGVVFWGLGISNFAFSKTDNEIDFLFQEPRYTGTATLGSGNVFEKDLNTQEEVNHSFESVERSSTEKDKQNVDYSTVQNTESESNTKRLNNNNYDNISNEVEGLSEINTAGGSIGSDRPEFVFTESIINSASSDSYSLLTMVRGLLSPESISTTLKTLLVTSVFTLAPAFILITTSFIRISVVLSLLRQALGAGQVPSNQIIAVLSVFLTMLIMAPVWTNVYDSAVVPYSVGEIADDEALQRGQYPIKAFLWKQIEHAGNTDTVELFLRYVPDSKNFEYYEDLPWRVLAPSFVLSELKVAFLIGFQIFLPFLIIDLVISSVLVSSGMMMLPPAIVSLPFKLALFVLVDGWTLVIKSLLESFI